MCQVDITLLYLQLSNNSASGASLFANSLGVKKPLSVQYRSGSRWVDRIIPSDRSHEVTGRRRRAGRGVPNPHSPAVLRDGWLIIGSIGSGHSPQQHCSVTPHRPPWTSLPTYCTCIVRSRIRKRGLSTLMSSQIWEISCRGLLICWTTLPSLFLSWDISKDKTFSCTSIWFYFGRPDASSWIKIEVLNN